MIKLAVVIGSTRPGRNGEAVAHWVHDLAAKRGDVSAELVDIKDFGLPLLDEPMPPSMGMYAQPHTRRWAAKVAGFDAFVFVTPEYNHATSAALKNAIDFLFREWQDKAAGMVAYGTSGGAGAVENLRLILGQVGVATVRSQVNLSLYTDFVNFRDFRPAARHEQSVSDMLDQVASWAGALRSLRT